MCVCVFDVAVMCAIISGIIAGVLWCVMECRYDRCVCDV